MIYSNGDILKVMPLKGQYKSNVRNPYYVIVVSDDKDKLVTDIPIQGYNKRVFEKNRVEWVNGHRFRFDKVGHSSDASWMKKLLTQNIS